MWVCVYSTPGIFIRQFIFRPDFFFQSEMEALARFFVRTVDFVRDKLEHVANFVIHHSPRRVFLLYSIYQISE